MSQGLELAAQCDAEGRHDDAVNALAVASRENDFVAMTELARRLIIGDRAPLLPQDGAKLMSDAARSRTGKAIQFRAPTRRMDRTSITVTTSATASLSFG